MNITGSAYWADWRCWMWLIMISTHYQSGYVSSHPWRGYMLVSVVSLSCLTGESVYQWDDYMLLMSHDSHEFNSSDEVLWGRITLTIIKKQKGSQIFLHDMWILYINERDWNGFWLVSLVCILLYISPWRWFHLAHSKPLLMKNRQRYGVDFITHQWCDRF